MKVRPKQGFNPTDKYWWVNPEKTYDAQPADPADDGAEMLRVDWPEGTPHDLPREWFEEVAD